MSDEKNCCPDCESKEEEKFPVCMAQDCACHTPLQVRSSEEVGVKASFGQLPK